MIRIDLPGSSHRDVKFLRSYWLANLKHSYILAKFPGEIEVAGCQRIWRRIPCERQKLFQRGSDSSNLPI